MPYKPNEITVITNESGHVLNIREIVIDGEFFSLGLSQPDDAGDQYGECVDIEELGLRESVLVTKAPALNKLEASGHIKFHPKGTIKRGAKVTGLGAGQAPPNMHDAALNKVIEKEKELNDRTTHTMQPRATPAAIGRPS